MPFVKFKFRDDFEEITKKGLSPAQFQLLKELFLRYQVDEDELYNIMHKRPEAIGFKLGDRVLYKGYAHLRPDQKEFKVYEVSRLHLDCLTDVSIKAVSGGEKQRVYHRDLVKIDE
jgi:hypothetical protein